MDLFDTNKTTKKYFIKTFFNCIVKLFLSKSKTSDHNGVQYLQTFYLFDINELIYNLITLTIVSFFNYPHFQVTILLYLYKRIVNEISGY